jgi:hypothetical protein
MAKTTQIEAPGFREYKFMLNPSMFEGNKLAIVQFHDELLSAIEPHVANHSKERFQVEKQQDVEFLDTSGHHIFGAGFLLRKRKSSVNKSKGELTLKCRAPDLCIALRHASFAATGLKDDSKLEEDICTPFVSRFSRSTTVKLKGTTPQTIGDAAEFFPILAKVAASAEGLVSVNGIQVAETVYTGPTFSIDAVQAESAIIMWLRGTKPRIAAMEFSFRIPFGETLFESDVASRFLGLFLTLQKLDWAAKNLPTKTAYIYGSQRV